MLNTAYLIANTLGLGFAWVLGYFFDRFGLLISRILTASLLVDISKFVINRFRRRDGCNNNYSCLILIHIINTICLSPKYKVYNEVAGDVKTEGENKALLNDKNSDVKKAYPIVISLTVATLSSVALSISSLFWKYSAVYASSIFAVILKGTMYATYFLHPDRVAYDAGISRAICLYCYAASDKTNAYDCQPYRDKFNPTSLKCGPPAPSSPTEDEETHRKITKDTLIIGEENLSKITATLHQNVKIESFLGARFKHFTDMLKDKAFVVGELLPKAEQTNIDSINRSMGHCEWATVIPKLDTQIFKIDSNSVMGILWKEDTVRHWLEFLN
ncbi:hypothetical protein LSH36_1559g00004 [Paralvinella palmiformis]|uniref:Uncharacterized protein n=1 Tax=Paralvinella palmiformis TaxID=53620 RepID=A0AAD9MQE2_9ANNE|nr:hypothetical protein LSH36_1559g00004 [Paralvinella palmiformis]